MVYDKHNTSTSSHTKFFDIPSYCLQQTVNTRKENVVNSCNENVLNFSLLRDTFFKVRTIRSFEKNRDVSDIKKSVAF